MDRSDFNNSLSLGLSILENATRNRRPFSLAELTRFIDAPKTTMFRLLKTLCELNYLKYDIHTNRYSLGMTFHMLGVSSFQSMEIREVAKPFLEELSRKWDTSVNLLVLNKGEMIYIERAKVDNVRDLNINIGTRIPVHNTAAGIAVLAYLEKSELMEVITGLKSNPDSYQEIGKHGNKLFKSLKEARANGFVAVDKAQEKGIRSVAVAIFSRPGDRYAINVAVASEMVSMAVLKNEYAPTLMTVAAQISNALGYTAGSEHARG